MRKIRLITSKNDRYTVKYISINNDFSLLDTPSYVMEESTPQHRKFRFAYSGSIENGKDINVPNFGSVSIGKYTGRVLGVSIDKGSKAQFERKSIMAAVTEGFPTLTVAENTETGFSILETVLAPAKTPISKSRRVRKSSRSIR